mmetsp:Transcript_29712/g.76822  ORF Transcript_29712/g.76822 Transcript_29712/m.76822 type:complete len:558 (+) Transcript_29712:47-1720(+)
MAEVTARPRKGDRVVYKELTGRKWRAATIISAARNGEAAKICCYTSTGVCDHDVNVSLLRVPSAEQEEELSKHWEIIETSRSDLLAGSSASTAEDLPHEPLHEFLKRRGYKAPLVHDHNVRLATWNVKHYGAKPVRSRAHDIEGRKQAEANLAIHDDERARNLVEVIHDSRCSLVVLQEVSRAADLALLCRLLEERSKHADTMWHSTDVIGEHAMLYQPVLLAAALGCPLAALRVEGGLYERDDSLSPAFQAATDWRGDGTRFDFTMQGASGARLPALFFVHADASAGVGRSIAVCSVHLAFGAGGKSEVRERQLAHLSSLMPGAAYTPGRCLYALMGDFNSNASVVERGRDLASSALGERIVSEVNSASPGHVLALQAGRETSIAGERYDEVVVHGAVLGRRHAHVYPKREDIPQDQMHAALPPAERTAVGDKSVHMAFCNIFSDHLLVYVDLQFARDDDQATRSARNGQPLPPPPPADHEVAIGESSDGHAGVGLLHRNARPAKSKEEHDVIASVDDKTIVHRRPRGRAPKGANGLEKIWNTTLGTWQDQESSTL